MLWKISYLLDRLGIRIPEIFWKEEIVRFITESKSERIVEIPLILRSIPRKKSKILDIGCRYSLLPIQLSSMGHKVYGIDIYPYQRKHPNLHFLKGDFLEAHLKNNFFDVVISLSTIEHIGLGFYKEKLNNEGDRDAVEKVKRILKPKGTFLLTVPFGKPTDSNWYRVYNRKRIVNLLEGFKIFAWEVFAERQGNWMPFSITKAEKMDSSSRVRAVIFISTRKE